VHTTTHGWLFVYFTAVTVASFLHSTLPPWDAEAFVPFPTFQKYYKVLIYVLGYIALNARSTIYPSISVNNPNGVNSQAPVAAPKA
jgi:hypothetical protein